MIYRERGRLDHGIDTLVNLSGISPTMHLRQRSCLLHKTVNAASSFVEQAFGLRRAWVETSLDPAGTTTGHVA